VLLTRGLLGVPACVFHTSRLSFESTVPTAHHPSPAPVVACFFAAALLQGEDGGAEVVLHVCCGVRGLPIALQLVCAAARRTPTVRLAPRPASLSCARRSSVLLCGVVVARGRVLHMGRACVGLTTTARRDAHPPPLSPFAFLRSPLPSQVTTLLFSSRCCLRLLLLLQNITMAASCSVEDCGLAETTQCFHCDTAFCGDHEDHLTKCAGCARKWCADCVDHTWECASTSACGRLFCDECESLECVTCNNAICQPCSANCEACNSVICEDGGNHCWHGCANGDHGPKLCECSVTCSICSGSDDDSDSDS